MIGDKFSYCDVSRQPPHLCAIQLLSSIWASRMVYFGVKKGIFKLVYEGKRTVDQLTAKLNINSEVLSRVLKGMVHLNLLHVNGKFFELTTVSSLFVPSTPGNFCSMALLWGEEFSNAWGEIESAISGNTSGFQSYYKTNIFSYLTQHPITAENFDGAMESLAFHIYPSVVDILPLAGVKHVVDVGGGSGLLAKLIKRKYNNIDVTVFDLSHVIERTKKLSDNFEKISFVSGDFFSSVPSSEFHILANVIHDWGNEDAVKILKNVRKSQTNKSILCLVEMIVDHPNEPSLARSTDLNMMMLTGGKERSKEEMSAILSEAGFSAQDIINVENLTCLVVAASS